MEFEKDLEKLISQCRTAECAYWRISLAQKNDKIDNETLEDFNDVYRKELQKFERMKEEFLKKYRKYGGNSVKTFTYIREYEESNIETSR